MQLLFINFNQNINFRTESKLFSFRFIIFPFLLIKGKSESVKFKNAAYYTDYCLKKFFDKVKNEKWYNNTIFILVADHGHILPRNNDYSSPAAFRIPLLIVGPALKDEFKNDENLISIKTKRHKSLGVLSIVFIKLFF